MKDQRSKREKAPGGKGLRWGLGSTMLVGRLTKLNKTVVFIFLVTVNVDGRRRWKKGYFPQQNLDMWHPLTAQCHSMKDLQN